MTLLPKLRTQPTKTAPHPFLITHGIARDLVRQQPLKGWFDAGVLHLGQFSAAALAVWDGIYEASG